jgi:hypothetical protein
MAHRLIFRHLPALAYSACLLVGSHAAAHAQLTDPTRPPADLAAADSSAEGGAAVITASGLQTIILKKQGRPAAVINGELVELGTMIGESRLVKIDEDSVVLLSPSGRETLRLMPAAEKQLKVGADRTAQPIGMNAVKGKTP